jgi:trehalose synthase
MIIDNMHDRRIEDYRDIAFDDINKIHKLTESLKGYKITHVNSTSFGGGVAEILYALVPLMNSIGLKTSWEVIEAPQEFFTVTKKLHNSLQGAEISISDKEKELYLNVNKHNALKVLRLEGDVIFVHDPQPLGIKYFLSNNKKWIWRCHIDLSKPYEPTWKFISNLLKGYNVSVYHMKEFVHPEVPTPKVYVIPPSIDPLSEKNREMKWSEIEKIVKRYDINVEKPIITMVARFDPWKDPLGAIDIYRRVKIKIPEVQLLMVSSMAHDDPEGWIYFEKTIRRAGEDHDIYFLTNLIGVGAREVNAFQRVATVILQPSIREGFGLTVSEGMWKKKPVVARPSGGIKLQVIDGVTGYFFENMEEAANKIIYLIKHPEVREKIGLNAHEHIKKNFIVTSHLLKYLEMLNDMMRRE